MLKAVDSETTGLDLRHGAKPFFWTVCDEEDNVKFWEWDVDPLTREPVVVQEDLDELEEEIASASGLVLQNTRFDVTAAGTVRKRIADNWPWEKTFDTLFSGHLLASNQPLNLTTMVLIYLGINIKPLEETLKEAVRDARALAKKKYPTWKIAKEGLEGMPSAKSSADSKAKEKKGKQDNSCWGFDMWLPRAIAKEEGFPANHPWWTVLRDYSNADSACTLPLFLRHKELLEERKLWKIYLERLKVLRVGHLMEERGITLNEDRLNKLMTEYKEESESCKRKCLNIATGLGAELTLPKSGMNKSLSNFVFNTLKLEPFKINKTGPGLDAKCIEHYEATLDPRSKAARFLLNLSASRKRETAITYMNGYKKFWKPWICVQLDNPLTGAGWYVLHPSLNPTGTDTLRWSSSNPNEQNISKKEGFNLRWIFGPAPGREWWSCDAKNIELRLPAYESKETLLTDLFERPKDPPYYGSTHLLNFHTVYPDIWDKAVKEVGVDKAGPYCKEKYESTWYQWCKNGSFAVQYGAVEREKGTADKAFHRDGCHALLKSRFSKLQGLNQKCIKHANEHGYVETMPDSSIDPERGYPLLCSRNRWGAVLPTVPLNYHIQGTAMWWMNGAMTRSQDYLDELNKQGSKRYYIAMQIHDELVFDFPKGSGSRPWLTNRPKLEKIQKLMEVGGEYLGVPTPVSCKYHSSSWAEGISV